MQIEQTLDCLSEDATCWREEYKMNSVMMLHLSLSLSLSCTHTFCFTQLLLCCFKVSVQLLIVAHLQH